MLKFTRPEWSCRPTNPIFTNILFISSNLACLWDNLQTKHASWRFAPLVVGCQTVLLPCSVLREVVTGGSQEPVFAFFSESELFTSNFLWPKDLPELNCNSQKHKNPIQYWYKHAIILRKRMVLNQTVWEWHSLIPSCPWRFQMWHCMKNCQQAHKKLQFLQLHANLDISEGPKGKFCSKANNFQAPVTSDMYTCQLFLRYKRDIFILGVLRFLKTTRSFPKIPEEFRRRSKSAEGEVIESQS